MSAVTLGVLLRIFIVYSELPAALGVKGRAGYAGLSWAGFPSEFGLTTCGTTFVVGIYGVYVVKEG